MMAQINTTVGDFGGNRKKILRALEAAGEKKADLVTFPELTLTGYPPEDLLFERHFVDENLKLLHRVASKSAGLRLILGFVDRGRDGRLYNAAAFIEHRKIRAVYRKRELPNTGVFDEYRYFYPGDKLCVVTVGSARVALTICEDIWQKSGAVYDRSFRGQTDLLVNISASPYYCGKQAVRFALVRGLALYHRTPVVYQNLVGGQDELVFDGASLAVSSSGRLLAQAAAFEEDFAFVDVPLGEDKAGTGLRPVSMGRDEEVYRALVLGTRDYVQKCGFKKVLIGLSGGIDSALVARVAVDALGAANVIGVTMPSPYTSGGTYRDAKLLAARLGIRCLEFNISGILKKYLAVLKNTFAGRSPDITEENLQARIRGNLLMALSNKWGYLVLTTGNKSEMATGYCTLYGDMAGGFAVIKDVPKTLVFLLARYRNTREPKNSIPRSTLRRPPTAELKAGQKDRDTLPPYELLDPLLEEVVENNLSPKKIHVPGLSKASVLRVVRMIKQNEYKRRQAPPGIKITPRAFGRDRRMPISNRFAP